MDAGTSCNPSEKTPDTESGVFFSSPDALFASSGVWRANSLTTGEGPVCSTGYPALDRCLPGGGWPLAGLTEILSPAPGVGELRLLMPALARLVASREGWVAWIAPPYRPNAPALQQWSLPPSRLLVIHPRKPADVAWAAEQALGSGTCIAVVCWPRLLESARGALSIQPFLRRLQVTAAHRECWAVAMRHSTTAQTPSAAGLRIAIEAQGEQRDLALLKVRGGRPARVAGFDAGLDVDAGLVR